MLKHMTTLPFLPKKNVTKKFLKKMKFTFGNEGKRWEW